MSTADLQALVARNNIVISRNLADGTQAIRDLVGNLGGVRQAARLLGEDIDTVAKWTQKGMPAERVDEVKQLARMHEGANVGAPQCRSYDTNSSFRMLR